MGDNRANFINPETGHPWNWKGGRIVEPRGYILVFVGKDHPLADCRGYAYEHRLKVQARTDRPLESKEHVHHDNENRSDNSDDNLILTAGIEEHLVYHRKSGKQLRMPGEANPEIKCSCGCGSEMPKYDSSGRPRKFISGHNPQSAPTMEAIKRILEINGPLRRPKIFELMPKFTRQAIICALSRMKGKGMLSNSNGAWCLNCEQNDRG